MRYRVAVVWIASLMIVALVYTVSGVGGRDLAVIAGAQAAEKDRQKSGGPPPLVINRDAPLLLEEPPEVDPLDVPIGPVADNTACFVCHTNYEEESFAVVHAKANVGCMKCHGASLDHRDDEDNITPPDVMFAAEKIEANCEKCHEEHDVSPVEIIARWQQCCPYKTDPKTILCTDCHGKHRLKFRTVVWNKRTGELIVRREEETTAKGLGLTEKKPEKAMDETADPDSYMQ